MPRATWVELIEFNDWEGETWSKFIPVAGNEEALSLLQARIKQLDQDADYPAFLMREHAGNTEHIEALIAGSDSGYMERYARGPERLDVDKVKALVALDDDSVTDALYKGGIRDLAANGA